MSFSTPFDDTETAFSELLVLDLISKQSKTYTYVACFKKSLYEVTVSPMLLKKYGRNKLQYGTVLNGSFIYKKQEKEIFVESVKCIYMLDKAKPMTKWQELSILFSVSLKRDVIVCNALTNGCFTYLQHEYSTPAVYNNLLGIIADHSIDPKIPKKSIGKLVCSVFAHKLNNSWHFFVESVKKFDTVLSITMSAQVGDDEHFGLVTREECEIKRDLRLVSSRDFPRDVRIFRSGTHCCEGIDIINRRNHDHTDCLTTCVGEVNYIGKSMAIKMKRCHGMANCLSPIDDTPIIWSPSISSDGQHVDANSMRDDVQQLIVNVHGGFVEIETISEYSGFTDHNGYPLLWSHDVEFVVDFSKVFQERPFGLYIIKVVRFHRANVFAKWRLARRNPIIKSLQTKFHSQSPHSINLATIGISALDLCEEPRARLPSFSRFGTTAQSCCLPRTDSLDNVELFDALVRNSINDFEAIVDDSENEKMSSGFIINDDDRDMWLHHDNSVLKIIEDQDPLTDENSNSVHK